MELQAITDAFQSMTIIYLFIVAFVPVNGSTCLLGSNEPRLFYEFENWF